MGTSRTAELLCFLLTFEPFQIPTLPIGGHKNQFHINVEESGEKWDTFLEMSLQGPSLNSNLSFTIPSDCTNIHVNSNSNSNSFYWHNVYKVQFYQRNKDTNKRTIQ